MKKQNFVISLVIVAIVGISLYWFAKSETESRHPAFHEHANFAVFLDGTQYNFNQTKYMTEEADEVGLKEFVHMHDMNGGVIHLHKAGITLGMFFESIGIELNSTCFVLENGTSYCNSADKSLKMFVNGQPNNEFDKLQLHDLQKILISYGNRSDSAIQNQINMVPSDACIYSGKCPVPPGFEDNESLTCVTNTPGICTA